MDDLASIFRSRDDLELGLRTTPFERSAVVAYKVTVDSVSIANIFYGGRDFELFYREVECRDQ